MRLTSGSARAPASAPPRWHGPADAPRTAHGRCAPWSSRPPRPPRGRRSCPWSAPRRPSWSASRPTVSNAARAAAGTRCRHRHEAPHVEPEAAARPRTSSPTSDGGHPLRPGRPVVSTCTRTRAPGAKRAIRAPSASRATLCHSPTIGASSAHLVALHGAEEVPHDVASSSPRRRLRRRAPPHSSRPGRRSPASARGAHRIGPEPLGHADHPHPGGIAAGALDPLPDRGQPRARPRR